MKMKRFSDLLLTLWVTLVLLACAGKTGKTDHEGKEVDTEETTVSDEGIVSTPNELEQLVQKVEANYGNYWNHSKGWDKELLKLLGEKPEYAELLPQTQLLIDFSLKREEAKKKWDEDVKKLDNYAQIFQHDIHTPIDREWEEKFISLVHDNPTLLHYQGGLIETITGFSSLTTEDQNLRLYYWDTGRGGEINALYGKFYQFRTDDGRVHVPMFSKLKGIKATPSLLNDDDWMIIEMPWETGPVPDIIYVLDTEQGRVYLENVKLKATATMYFEKLEAKSISSGDIVDFPIFEADGKKSASVESAYGGIKYDEKSHTLIVEKYKEREKYDEKEGWFMMTGTDTYVFDGKIFKKEPK